MDPHRTPKCSNVKPAARAGHLGFIKQMRKEELSIKRHAAEIEGPERRLLGVVYFYLKSNLPSLINDSDEGSDSVPGDGKRKKERALPGLFGPEPEEREPSSSPS